MNRRGFTLLELIVAVGIMLVLAAAATPLLLKHIKEAKVAGISENLLNVKAAFDSYFTKSGGILTDSDSDNDYLDEMINDGWLSNDPSKNGLVYTVEAYSDSGKTAYFVKIVNADSDGLNYISPLVSRLDESIDGEDNDAQGRFQYSIDASSFTGYYLLYADAGMTTWHP